MAWRILRDFPWELDPDLYGDKHYNVFTREFYPSFEDIMGAFTSGIDEDIESAILFGSLRSNVVGLRYYTGIVNNNEMVALQREPNNPFDKNAVKVNNVNGEQVGHIKKEVAACLAYIMDNKLAVLEGVVPYGSKNTFTMPVQLSFWGKEENKQMVVERLKMHGLKLAPPEKSFEFGNSWTSGKGKGKASYGGPVHHAIQMTTEQLKTEFDKLFEDLKEDNKTCEMEAVDAVLTPLLPHQKQALAWMVLRENNKELPPFWEERDNYFYNTITNFAEKKRPENVLGGILADDMGLGKTLTVIAVILTNFHNGKPFPFEKRTDQLKEKCIPTVKNNLKASKCDLQLNASDSKEENDSIPSQSSKSRPKRTTGKKPKYTSSDTEPEKEITQKITTGVKKSNAATRKRRADASPAQPKKNKVNENLRATLIICPLSVLSNWIDQFEQHVDPNIQLNIYVYYGSERSKDPAVLSKQDIVLTTYSVLANDYGTRNSTLHKLEWLRVVLDEGHTVRNPNAKQTKAVLDLNAERRWVLTGTPIQNSLKDLWSLLSFLKLKPFTDRAWWHRTIQRPVTLGDQGGLKRLQTLIKCITLRRTKTSKVNGKPVLKLPERKVFIQHVTLTDEESRIYHSVKNESIATISRYFKEGSVLTHYADVLGILLRLRQLCCHPYLCANVSPSSSVGDTTEELHERLIQKIKFILSSGTDEECAICLESLTFPVITHCAHVFCKPCIYEIIQREKANAKCPLCRNEVAPEHLVECPLEESHCEKNSSQEWLSSTKVTALMHALTELKKQNPAIKSLIVSQFTKFLSVIETPLKESGFAFVRLDGSMTQKKRIDAIQQFQSNETGSPTIMLLSLKAGGVGLNLTAASRVFLMDPAWNPGAEDQCFDRCHRIGQKQDVIITKFIVKNSVEENMLKIQDKKRELAAGAFGTKKLCAGETKMDEIRILMDM